MKLYIAILLALLISCSSHQREPICIHNNNLIQGRPVKVICRNQEEVIIVPAGRTLFLYESLVLVTVYKEKEEIKYDLMSGDTLELDPEFPKIKWEIK